MNVISSGLRDDVEASTRSSTRPSVGPGNKPQPGPTRAETFAQIYRREYGIVLGFLRRRVASQSQAEDIAHEIFLIAWRKFDDIPTEPGAQRGWLLTIARNCLLNETRSNTRQNAFRKKLTTTAVTVIPPSDDAVGDKLQLTKAWAALSPPDREVIALTAIDELSATQAGQVLGISANAYRHRLSRARAAFRKTFEA